MMNRRLFCCLSCAFCCVGSFYSQSAFAQQPALMPLGLGDQGGQQNQGQVGGTGREGGAASADFDSLIELIQSTVSADTWMENGTGDGEVQPFPTGVYADARGTLRFAPVVATATSLAKIPKRPEADKAGELRRPSEMRYVSLPRLEAVIRSRQLAHKPLAEEMLTLAGLQRIEYVFVVPASDAEPGDLVLAGPAGDWRVRADGKIVSTITDQPIVRLDDFITLLRRYVVRRGKPFGVSINPRQTGLAKVQEFVKVSNAQPIDPSERGAWLESLRSSLGKQDVEFFGIEPDSHAARVLLVADYHMKLIGMGLAEGVEGVTSYLKNVKVGADGSVPPMTILRWWFAMQYDPVITTAARDVFQLRGPGAKVLSENEMLAARGQRVHTGKSEDLNKRYADSFTEHYQQICRKYPLYTELRNVFDLSMVLALIDKEKLLSRAGWQPTLFANADWLPLPQMRVPAEVETVINHRVIRRKHIIAGVSGGVWIDAKKTLQVEATTSDLANAKATPAPAGNLAVWWWD